MTTPSKGAQLGTMIREKWLVACKERKFWYVIAGCITFLVMMASRTAAYTFTTAARLIMTAAYLYRSLTYNGQLIVMPT